MRRGIAIALSVLLIIGALPMTSTRAKAAGAELAGTCISWAGTEIQGVKENVTSGNWGELCLSDSEKPEVVVDLGAVKNISQIKTWPVENFALYYGENYQFLVSTDGVQYQAVVTVTGDSNAAYERIYEFDSIAARYVKMAVSKCSDKNGDITFGLRGIFAYESDEPAAKEYEYTKINVDASQVTSNHTLEDWGFGKANLVSGTPNWQAAYMGCTVDEINGGITDVYPVWIAVDLQTAQKIGKLALYSWAAANDSAMPKDFTIEVSDDGENWTVVKAVTGYSNPTGWPDEFTFIPVEARHIRLNVTAITGPRSDNPANNYLCLTQMEVFSAEPKPTETPAAPENPTQYDWIDLSEAVAGLSEVATDRDRGNFPQTVITSNHSYEDWGLAIANLIDGKVDNYRYVGAAASEVGTAIDSVWIKVDLQDVYTINEFEFDGYAIGTEEGLPKDFTIEVSEDGETWTTVKAVTGNTYNADGSLAYQYWFDEVDARYVRLNVTAIGVACDVGNYVCLREIKVYGKKAGVETPTGPMETPAAPENPTQYDWIDLSEAVAGLSEVATDRDRGNFPQTVITSNHSYEDWGLAIANLIDGKVDNYRYVGAAASEVGTAIDSVWIKVDLQDVYTINEFEFDGYAIGTEEGLPKDFTIEVSEDGETWTTVKAVTGNTYNADGSLAYQYWFDEVDARYVRLNVTAIGAACDVGNYVCLREIKVYGKKTGTETPTGPTETPAAPENPTQYDWIDLSVAVAGFAELEHSNGRSNFPQTVITSNHSYEAWGLGIANLIDGQVDDFRYVGAADSEVGTAIDSVWIKVDLQDVYTINEYEFDSYAIGSNQGMPKDFTIEVSEDGETWTTVKTVTGHGYDPNGTLVNRFWFDEVAARYVRLNVTAVGEACDIGNYVCLREIKVYGKKAESETPDPEPTVTYTKETVDPSWVTSNHSLEVWGFSKDHLVSGTPDWQAAYMGCTVDEINGQIFNVYPVWIAFDLQKEKKLGKLAITSWANADGGALPKDFTIEVSNDGANWTVVRTEKEYMPSTGGVKEFTFDPVNARHIRINVNAITGPRNDNPANNYLCLTQMEVFSVDGGEEEPDEPVEAQLPGNEIDLSGINKSTTSELESGSFQNLFDNNTETGYVAKANDGKPASGMVPVWVQIDLKSAKPFDSIRLASLVAGGIGGFPTDFDIMTSNDGVNWAVVKSVSEGEVVPVQNNNWYTFNFNTVTARYVRLFVRNVGGVGDPFIGYTLHLREFEVLLGGSKIDLSGYVSNIATWKAAEGINYIWASDYAQSIVSASISYEMWGWGAASLIDGSIDSKSSFATADSGITGPVSRLNETLRFNFSTPQRISNLSFASLYANSMKGVPTEFELRGSLDGTEWYSLVKQNSLPESKRLGDRWFTFTSASNKPVRFVELIIRGVDEAINDELGMCAALSELKLHGTADPGAMDQLYGTKIDISKGTIRANISYNLWGHGTGNLYDNDLASTLFIGTTEDDSNYYLKFKDTQSFENKCDVKITIRLDGIYQVGRMKFESWWENAPHGVPSAFTLEGSKDGKTWETMYTNRGTPITESGWYNFRFGTKEARYLRLCITSVEGACDLGWVPALRELEFYGYVVSLDNTEEDLAVELPAPPSEDEFLNVYDRAAGEKGEEGSEDPSDNEPGKEPASGSENETGESGNNGETTPTGDEPGKKGIGPWPFIGGGVILAGAIAAIVIISKKRGKKS